MNNYRTAFNVDDDNIDTLIAKTQERFYRALQRRYQFESNLKSAQQFLIEYVNSKIPLVVMYADLVGSTKLSMTLSIDKVVTIIRGFSYEMSNIIHLSGGYPLKYVGDAVIAFFPSFNNKADACNKSVKCAKLMIKIIKNGISPILNLIIQHGHDESSPIDILGYCMNRSAKITSLTYPNKIMVGEDVYRNLNSKMIENFNELQFSIDQWKYSNKQTGQIYRLYSN
jgi:class 3 adenylate cyclase